MKIGIVTISDITNYGNRLQNYALSYTLKNKYKCGVCSLASFAEKPYENRTLLLSIKNLIARKMSVFPKLAEKKFGPNITRWANFYSWNKKHILARNFYNQTSLSSELNKQYDLFLAGSDQIWNYRFPGTKFDDYFLKFSEDKKKVAICGSFGVEEIPNEFRDIYIDGLSSFAHISVREDAGAKIVKDLIGRDVPVLVDPVMMLSREEWLKVSKKPRMDTKKPYVLKYYLGDENEEDKIDIWAKAQGFEVYELLNDKIPELYSAGPGEFVSLIANASLVVSDSFHCIAFSIIFKKPFIVYERQGSGNYMTSRLDTLLNKFGLQNRWKHMLESEEYFVCDHSKTDELLKKEQEKFDKYLKEVLRFLK